MPGTLRSASSSELAAVSRRISCGITVTARGVSRSGAVNFGELGASVVALTSRLSRRVACCGSGSVADSSLAGAAGGSKASPKAEANRRLGAAGRAMT
jgi:hypothetical protein